MNVFCRDQCSCCIEVRIASLQRRHESSGKHSHSTLTPAHQTHTDRDECSADPFCFVCTFVSWAYTWAWAFFRAESSDLSHMGVYTGMGVILVWVLLRANTAYICKV